MNRTSTGAIFLFSLLLAHSSPAATIAGTVVDPDGRAVAGAHVIVAGAVGVVADVVTDTSGAFSIDVPAGDYELRIAAAGFQANPIALSLGANDRRSLEVPLRISAVAESIVVSASQVEMPLSRAADSVTVISSADLETHQVETVADALRLVPGLAVARSGGRGAITSLFPRGGASNYTLVLVDGMRTNAFGGGYDFAHLATADVDRVEIVRGPESALFGSDAIGGVVQIVTKRGGRPRADGLVEGGNQATMRASLAASGTRGAWSVGAAAEHTQSGGFTGIAPADGERVTNDDYHLNHFSATAGWQRTDGPDLLISANAERDERGFPGPFGSDPIKAFPGIDRVSRGINHTGQIGARFTHPWSPQIRERIEASYTDLTGDFTSAFGPSSSGTRRLDGRILEDFALTSSIGASGGVEALRERGTSTFITGATNEPLPIQRAVVGTFGELRYASRDRLFVTGGVRVEHITRDSLEASVGEFSSRPAFPAQTVNSVNPKVAVSYVLSQSDAGVSTRLRASAGTGIRPPDAFEIAFTDNPNLKPERSRSVDAGLEQLLAGGKLTATANAFLNRYDQLIVTVGRSLHDASRYQSDNISNARARGVELGANARLGRRLTVRGTYTFLDSEILAVDRLVGQAPPPFHVGDALIRRPRHQAGADITYSGRRFTAFGEATARSRLLDVEPNFGGFGGLFYSAGYTVINAGARVHVARMLDLYARVLNLADRTYEETLGFPALRRSGIVGIRFAAGR